MSNLNFVFDTSSRTFNYKSSFWYLISFINIILIVSILKKMLLKSSFLSKRLDIFDVMSNVKSRAITSSNKVNLIA